MASVIMWPSAPPRGCNKHFVSSTAIRSHTLRTRASAAAQSDTQEATEVKASLSQALLKQNRGIFGTTVS